jgi:dTDP-4-dehydrorhamnose 3,5-epimerase
MAQRIVSEMLVETTRLPGVLVITPRVFSDPRGFFFESYNQETFRSNGIDTLFVQDNHSKSVRNALRGLHFQLPPTEQVKLVRVVRGTIWDVAVDIRAGSPTFGHWLGVELSAENFRQLLIPAGYAHGFCVMSEEAEVLYKASQIYSPQHERGILWNDADLAIDWPIDSPLLSERDRRAAHLAEYLAGTPFRVAS